MTDKRTPKDAETARPAENDQDLPFRRSSSAGEYDPAGNWGAERRTDAHADDAVSGQRDQRRDRDDG